MGRFLFGGEINSEEDMKERGTHKPSRTEWYGVTQAVPPESLCIRSRNNDISMLISRK